MARLPNMALQRTRRPSLCSGRSLRSLGSPLNAQPLGAALITATLSLYACGHRHPIYVVAEGTPAGEIVIEHSNPACLPLAASVSGVEIRVPASGYLCTSTSSYPGWSYRSYVLQGSSSRRSLKLNREIFNHSTFQYGKQGCEMVGESFFYLPGGAKVETGANFEGLFRLHHDCDPWIQATVKPGA